MSPQEISASALEISPAVFSKMVSEATALLVARLEHLGQSPARNPVPQDGTLQTLRETAPEQGQPYEEVLKTLFESGLAGSEGMHVGH